MSTPRFTIVTKTGKVVTGVVHGSGGSIRHLQGLNFAIRQATKGRDSTIYEPKPGHAAVYPDYNAAGNGRMVAVDMRGATAHEAPPKAKR